MNDPCSKISDQNKIGDIPNGYFVSFINRKDDWFDFVVTANRPNEKSTLGPIKQTKFTFVT